jgi:hypothetical protein
MRELIWSLNMGVDWTRFRSKLVIYLNRVVDWTGDPELDPEA